MDCLVPRTAIVFQSIAANCDTTFHWRRNRAGRREAPRRKKSREPEWYGASIEDALRTECHKLDVHDQNDSFVQLRCHATCCPACASQLYRSRARCSRGVVLPPVTASEQLRTELRTRWAARERLCHHSTNHSFLPVGLSRRLGGASVHTSHCPQKKRRSRTECNVQSEHAVALHMPRDLSGHAGSLRPMAEKRKTERATHKKEDVLRRCPEGCGVCGWTRCMCSRPCGAKRSTDLNVFRETT